MRRACSGVVHPVQQTDNRHCERVAAMGDGFRWNNGAAWLALRHQAMAIAVPADATKAPTTIRPSVRRPLRPNNRSCFEFLRPSRVGSLGLRHGLATHVDKTRSLARINQSTTQNNPCGVEHGTQCTHDNVGFKTVPFVCQLRRCRQSKAQAPCECLWHFGDMWRWYFARGAAVWLGL